MPDTRPPPFADFDLSAFWQDDLSGYQRDNIIAAPFTAESLASIEAELGYTLPAAYVALMRTQNGGLPVSDCFPTTEATSWADDHVALTALFGIGRDTSYSLCGDLGSVFMIEEWGYPPIGVYFADCPSAGHDMIALDYRACGPHGEPCVVHVDQEDDYRITWLAPDFESFIRGLQPSECFDEPPEESRARELAMVEHAPFGPTLSALLAAWPDPQMGALLRRIAARIVNENGVNAFALHGNPLSWLMYDLQFLLYTHSRRIDDLTHWRDEVYELLIAFADEPDPDADAPADDADDAAQEDDDDPDAALSAFNEVFSSGGYAPDFVADWLARRQTDGDIVATAAGWQFSAAFRETLLTSLQAWRSPAD